MDGDEIADAFSLWKAAHDSFLAKEQQYFDTVKADARRPSLPSVKESDQLLIQVQVERAHAENLLLAAMKLLHERRHHDAGTRDAHFGMGSIQPAATSPTQPPNCD